MTENSTAEAQSVPKIPPAEPNGTLTTGDDMELPSLLDQLYEYTTSDFETESKERVWLKSSKPTTISLKLQDIQAVVRPQGLLDTDTFNMAIRKMVMEDKSFGSWKHCLSSDFARHAISRKCRDADFGRLIRDEFLSRNNYHNLEVLCIPVIHESENHWTLYAFSMNDSKLYILDPEINHGRHAVVKIDICEVLELMNDQFGLFSNLKIEFKRWDCEFAKVPQQNNRYDCGFFIFNFIRQWDGFGLSNSLHFHYDTLEIRKEFISYILSFQGNEAASQLPSNVSDLIKQLSDLKNSWPENGTMEIRLLEAMKNGDVQGFQRLLNETDAQELDHHNNGRGEGGVEQAGRRRCKLLLGATSEGDGALHIAARFGHVEVVHALLFELGLLGSAASNNQAGEGEEIAVNTTSTLKGAERKQTRTTAEQVPATCNNPEDNKGVSVSSQKEADHRFAACILRARNCKGETCLHDAVRTGCAQTVRKLLAADLRLNDETGPPLVQIRDDQGSSPFFMAKTAGKYQIAGIIRKEENKYRRSDAGLPVRRTDISSLAMDELYKYIMSLEDPKLKEAVWLSNSYPSPITLKLRAIQKTVKANGLMDADSLNFAIRKLGTKDYYKPLGPKHYISTDFARCAIYRQGGGGYSSLETCIDDYFLDHHNAFDQGANTQYSQSNAEVLCIPVLHDSHWSLYAFNMNDNKVSILDPRQNCKCHKGVRPKICKALEYVKVKFNIFKNKSNDFRGWTYEVATECGLHGSDEDSGFLVFNYMRHWDGHQLLNPGWIPTESIQMRKEFLAYILSFNDNESYQLPPRVSELIKDLPAGPAWTRCEMDKDLLKALMGESNTDEFNKLFFPPPSNTAAQVTQERQEMLLRGTTCDGDGMFHIAVRLGKQQLLRTMEQLLSPSSDSNQDTTSNPERRITIEDTEKMMPVFAESLRARNNKGETCLHEAVRRGDKKFVESLISMDENEKLLKCKTSTPPLVQRVDYQGVSPLYLATTLRSADIVGFLTNEKRKCPASYAGPGGKTALHAALLLDNHKDAKELTEQLLKWMKNVAEIPDPIGMVDKLGNTPLHLLASVGGASTAELLLFPGSSPSPCTALNKKDSNGWFPIHVAAANGRVDIIRKLLEAWPDCMQSRNDSGQSFLHVAIEKKMQDVVAYVCGQQSLAGILNMRDRDGNTALHLAVKSGNQRMFCSLMSNKQVVLSYANNEGRTPRDLAKLSIEPGLHFLLNSRVLIHGHLKISGSGHGTYRRDLLENDKPARKLDKDKLSDTITKSAGLMAVCAIFMLNISVIAFFNVAKPYLTSSTDPNAAATPAPAAAPPPLTLSAAAASGGNAAVARARVFRALIVSDTITFASSSLAAFCSTFAGFSIMDHQMRFVFLGIAGFSLQIACMAVVAVFALAAYLAFAPTDPHIATAAYVLPIVAFTPQLITPFFILLLHAYAIFTRHVSPKLHDASAALHTFFQNRVSPIFSKLLPKICTTCIKRFFECAIRSWEACLPLGVLLCMPVIVALLAVAAVAGIIAFVVFVLISP